MGLSWTEEIIRVTRQHYVPHQRQFQEQAF